MHTDSTVYEKPFDFVPERWLGDISPKMIRNWVPFTRGISQLLGYKVSATMQNLSSSSILSRPKLPGDLKLQQFHAHCFTELLPLMTDR